MKTKISEKNTHKIQVGEGGGSFMVFKIIHLFTITIDNVDYGLAELYYIGFLSCIFRLLLKLFLFFVTPNSHLEILGTFECFHRFS